MPSRSFFKVPDQLANKVTIFQQHASIDAGLVEKFVANRIAPIVDEGSLAHLVGISPKIVFSIIRKKKKHYRTFEMPKKRGGSRRIDAPRTYVKVLQWWILDNILNHVTHGDCVTGFRSGCSPYLNARRHHGANHILNIDLKDFFGTVEYSQVLDIWKGIGYSEAVSQQLAELTTYRGVLPQGAPTSPAIANIAARQMDKAVLEVASRWGLNYTRYADDLTFSGFNRIADEVLAELVAAIGQSGFSVNGRKTRFLGRANRMEITGYVINSRPQLPRTWRKNARAAFFQAVNAPDQWHEKVAYLQGLFAAISVFCEPSDKLYISGQRAISLVKGRRGLRVVHGDKE